ncbi:MAG: glucosaminidase domain-containing protein [Treponema sp.]|jgi:hypothetical protein|nr:glucosaminidase domain-containing protein [Treponema sp.]
MKKQYFSAALSIIVFSLLFFSCVTIPTARPGVRSGGAPRPVPKQEPSRSIAGRGIKSAGGLTAFFLEYNPKADRAQIQRLSQFYIGEGNAEGINSDVAFVQMCLETGFLRFGGLVTPDMHNYCGLGALDAAHPGERFPSEQIGVRAHVQHLHAYGTTSALRQPLVDNRYRYVNPRGKAPDVFALSGTWASDRAYGEKLNQLLSLLAAY